MQTLFDLKTIHCDACFKLFGADHELLGAITEFGI